MSKRAAPTKSLSRTARPLARTASRPTTPKTRVLLVRQPVKSVRQGDEPDRAMLRLAVTVVAALAGLGGLAILGHVGFRLGFAPAVRVPDLALAPGGGLLTAARMIVNIPRVVLAAGLADPAWLMLAFLLIAVPAAGLSAARPVRPGGPRLPTAYIVLAVFAAVGAALNGAALVWWTASTRRLAMIDELPFRPEHAADWVADLQIVAGLDLLGVVAGVLWIILILRLPVPTWLRALATSLGGLALLIAAVAMATTNAAVGEITSDRSLCLFDDANDLKLMLGTTDHHTATVMVVQDSPVVELRDRPAVVSVVGSESLLEFLERFAPEDGRR